MAQSQVTAKANKVTINKAHRTTPRMEIEALTAGISGCVPELTWFAGRKQHHISLPFRLSSLRRLQFLTIPAEVPHGA